jgi:hypothetical protein
MADPTRARVPDAVEVRPGWRYLCLSPLDDGVFDEAVFAGLAWFVGQILGSYPHNFSRLGESAVVEVGPPDAARQARRLSDALREELAAEVEHDNARVLN